MSTPRPAHVAERVIAVAAGTTCAQAVAAAGLPTTGPDAIVVVRGQDGMLRDLSWAPETDTECEPVPMSSRDGLAVLRRSASPARTAPQRVSFRWLQSRVRHRLRVWRRPGRLGNRTTGAGRVVWGVTGA